MGQTNNYIRVGEKPYRYIFFDTQDPRSVARAKHELREAVTLPGPRVIWKAHSDFHCQEVGDSWGSAGSDSTRYSYS